MLGCRKARSICRRYRSGGGQPRCICCRSGLRRDRSYSGRQTEVAENSSQVSGNTGATQLPLVSEDTGATQLPLVSGDTGATQLPLVSGDTGATDLPLVSES